VATKLSAKLHIRGTERCDLLIIEPWAERVELTAGNSYELTATAEDQPWFEVEHIRNTVVVYVNGRSALFELSSDGKVTRDV
jgi:hypothetical protein